MVHDDNIQTELSAITDGELEFNNRPFIKHRAENIRDEFSGASKHRKNFGGRNNNRNNQGGRDNRNNRKFGKKRY